METHSNSRREKLVELACQIDQQLREEGLSPEALDVSLAHSSMGDLRGEEFLEIEKAREALLFLNQVRRHFDPGHNETAKFQSTIGGQENSGGEVESPILETIGRFEIVELVGQGGFAKVFRARDPLLDRDVALKIPKPNALMSDEARVRFSREARAAALLSHPQIVQIFETGMLGPVTYIASEYCEGRTLAEWFGENQRSIDLSTASSTVARLAEATFHAHQRGIIHRDLKPENILVQDGDAPLADRVRITDFGLAKQLESNDETISIDGSVIGTPAYMSPEQAQGSRHIGPSSDVFSLGVILYELLTGVLPFKRENHLATLKAIENETPASPRSINAAIPRDLDAICLKCLNKRPSDRYRTAFELAEDLNAWLDGRVVSARHATSLERVTRWTQRNPTLAIVGSMALLFLVGGLAGTTWQWRKSNHNFLVSQSEFKRAEENLKLANSAVVKETAARKMAERVAEFIGSTYRRSSPDQDGREVKIVDVLVRSENEIRILFANDQQTRWTLMRQLGMAYNSLGLFDDAMRVLQTTRDEQLAVDSKPNAGSVQLLQSLAVVNNAKGEYDEADALAELATTMAVEQLGQSHEVTIECFSVKAGTFQNRQRYDEAIALLESTIEIMDGVIDFPQEKYWRIKGQLGLALLASGKLEVAESVLAVATSNLEALAGADHPDTLKIKADYAQSLFRQNKLDDLVDVFSEIAESNARVMGPVHPQTLGSLNNLAVIYSQTGHLELARTTYEDCIDSCLEAFGDGSAYTAITRMSLANLLVELNELPAARDLYKESSNTFRNTIGPSNRRTSECMVSLARVYQELEQFADAAEMWALVSSDRLALDGKVSSQSSSASSQAGINLVLAGDVETGLERVNKYFEFSPQSGQDVESMEASITRLYFQVTAALVDQDRFETALPYAESFAKRAGEPGSFAKESDELLSTVFLATVLVNVDQSEAAADLIRNVLDPANDYSLADIEDKNESKWFRKSLEILIDSVRDDDLLASEFELDLIAFAEGH